MSTSGGSGGNLVSSVFGRLGAVVAASGDYDPGQVGVDVLSGTLGADQAVVADTTTAVLTTASLAVGTWFITMGLCVVNGAATAGWLEAGIGTGTATDSSNVGFGASGSELPALSGGAALVTIATVAVVTAAGTFVLYCKCENACTVKAATPNAAFGNASGWCAVKLA